MKILPWKGPGSNFAIGRKKSGGQGPVKVSKSQILKCFFYFSNGFYWAQSGKLRMSEVVSHDSKRLLKLLLHSKYGKIIIFKTLIILSRLTFIWWNSVKQQRQSNQYHPEKIRFNYKFTILKKFILTRINDFYLIENRILL